MKDEEVKMIRNITRRITFGGRGDLKTWSSGKRIKIGTSRISWCRIRISTHLGGVGIRLRRLEEDRQ